MPFWTRGGRKKEEERIDALEKAQESLEGRFKTIRLEWEDVYDRLTRTMGRLNARIRKSESLTAPEGDAEVSTDTPAPPPKPVGGHARLVEMRAKRNVLHG